MLAVISLKDVPFSDVDVKLLILLLEERKETLDGKTDVVELALPEDKVDGVEL